MVLQRSRGGSSATLRSCMSLRVESDSAVTGSRFTTDPPLPLARPSVEHVNTLVAGTAAAQPSQNVPDVVDGVSEESDHYVSSSSASSSDTAGDSTTTGTTTNASSGSSGESDNSHTDTTVSHYGPASRRVGTRALANAGVASRGGAACNSQPVTMRHQLQPQPVHMQQQQQPPSPQQQLQQVHVLGSDMRPMLLGAGRQAQPSPAAPRKLMTPQKKKSEKRQKNKDKAEQAASLCSAMTDKLLLNPGAVPFQLAKQTLLPGPQMASPGLMPWTSPHAVSSPLKALELPKVDGKVKSYLKWRQRFIRLIDDSYAMSENHKLAHLREALADGSAEELIADVLDGHGAYKAIMAELERWYGDQDRELNNQERELMEWPVLTNKRDVSQLKKFAIRLRNTLLNMEAVQVQPGRVIPGANSEDSSTAPGTLLGFLF